MTGKLTDSLGAPLTPPPTAPREKPCRLTNVDGSESSLATFYQTGRDLIDALECIFELHLAPTDSDDEMMSSDDRPADIEFLDETTMEDTIIHIRQYTAAASVLRDRLNQAVAVGTDVRRNDVSELAQGFDRIALGRFHDEPLPLSLDTRTSSDERNTSGLNEIGAVGDGIGKDNDERDTSDLNEIGAVGDEDEKLSPEEEEPRKQLRELDSRIEFRPNAKLAGLSAGGLLLLGAMKSPLALQALSKMLEDGRTALDGCDLAGEVETDDLDQAVRLCKQIQRAESIEANATIEVRWCDIQLYYEMRQRRGERRRNLSTDIEEITKRIHWSASQFKYHHGLGKKLSWVCGGHLGLAAFIPLDSTNRFGLGPIQMLHQMPEDEAKQLGALMRDDPWAETMCCLGREVMDYIMHGEDVSASVEDLLSSEHDFNGMTLQDLEALATNHGGMRKCSDEDGQPDVHRCAAPWE